MLGVCGSVTRIVTETAVDPPLRQRSVSPLKSWQYGDDPISAGPKPPTSTPSPGGSSTVQVCVDPTGATGITPFTLKIGGGAPVRAPNDQMTVSELCVAGIAATRSGSAP